MGPSVPESEKDWRAEDDARTLTRAEEIKSDKPRHGRARAHAAREISRLSKVAAGAKAKPEPTMGKSGLDTAAKGYRGC